MKKGAQMLSVEEAVSEILTHICPTDTVEVPLVEALDIPLAQDIVSDIDIAPFDNSSMDGFALKSDDTQCLCDGKSKTFQVVAEIGAGSNYDKAVGKDQAVRIMTGAPLPQGTDAVIKLEDIDTYDASAHTVTISSSLQKYENVRLHGMEAHANDVVLEEGSCLHPAGLGLCASCGISRVLVHRAPRVGIISLGSELVDACDMPRKGQIRDGNSSALMGAVCAAHAVPQFFGIVKDDQEQTRKVFEQAFASCDFVISSAGASAGDYDYVTQTICDLGKLYFDRVCMRPGKSQTFGMVQNTPFVGLAGNPAAALVGFEMLVRPALRKMRGFTDLDRPHQFATLLSDIKKDQPRRYYLRGLVERQGFGDLVVETHGNQNSSLYGALQESNCLIVVPEECNELVAGSRVEIIRTDCAEGSVL